MSERDIRADSRSDWARGEAVTDGGRESGEEKDEQRKTLERLIASGRFEPLVKGVGSAAGTSAAEGNRFQTEGERDVGIGGGAQKLRLESELGVHGADGG